MRRALLEAIAGPDPLDATSIPAPVGAYRAAARAGAKGRALKGVRIGVPEEYFQPGMDAEVEAAVRAALDELARAGARIVQRLAAAHQVRDRRPTTSSAPPRRRRTWRATTASATACAPPTRSSLEELYTKTRGDGFGAEVKRRIMLGTYALRAGYYDAYYGKALRARRKIADDFTRGVRGRAT